MPANHPSGRHRPAALAFACALAACAAPLPPTDPAELPRTADGFVPGYLPAKSLVDAIALLPAPPAPGSAQAAADEAFRVAALPLRGTPRWAQAARDADTSFPSSARNFSCALGVPIDPKASPNLAMLMLRTVGDAAGAITPAKKFYARARPFMTAHEPTCTPADESQLRGDGSYPSGHSAVAWTWALVLAEVAPERADAIVRRGREAGQSRVVCGVHWQSDVDAGRLAASAVVAQLHASTEFRAQLEQARREVAAARATGAAPDADCAAEAAALATR
jgi:acid phosphatase (class A)